MRIFCLIFIVQVFVLISQPCDEMFPPISQSGAATEQAFVTSHHSPEEQTGDTCSPFCTCGCCNHPVVQPGQTFENADEAVHPNIHTKPTTYRAPHASRYGDPVWQPPKA